MLRTFASLLFALPLAAIAAPAVPAADHHQHLFSPAIIVLMNAGPDGPQPIGPDDLIGHLDRAGIARAAVLSTAYMYGKPGRALDDEYARVKAENDWTGAQAAKYPDRLRAFCGFNPLKDYALTELERCAADPRLRHGLKFHFGNSDVQLDNPEHIAKLRQVFRAASRHRMAIAIHLRASISLKRPYGETQARAFLEQLLPEAPDSVVQVAHLAGAGPGYTDLAAREVMRVLAEAAARGDRNTRQLWFDVASIATPSITQEEARDLVQRMRQVGVNKILFGSDAATGANMRPREAWTAFRALPLSEDEFARIAANVAPYLR
jgi:predicted TIM-barrel fold metal-dependent hydrolase